MPQTRRQDDNAITESVELRWFFDGALPGRLLQQFKDFTASSKFETSQESRSDYYLKNNRETVGVKLRKDGDEKDIELKFLKASALLDENDVSGQVERWRKWQFPAAKFSFRNERCVLESEWIAVSKVRYLTRIPGPASNSQKEGCDFELASLSSQRGSFWTIGFEAFSDSGHEERNFRHAVTITSLAFFVGNVTNNIVSDIVTKRHQLVDRVGAGEREPRVVSEESLQRIRLSKDNSFSYPKFICATLLK